jgi:hypothetical protein
MKDFKDNLDEESIDKEGVDRFASATSSRTFVQKALQILSRYSLLVIVGLAALSITVLHFQGKHLLRALQGTPLPTFWLEKAVATSVVPDKTEVYEKVLAEEAKKAWQKRSKKITKPQWQASYSQPKAQLNTVRNSVAIPPKPPIKRKVVRKKQPRRKLPVPEPTPPVETVSFFQPVRAKSESLHNQPFVACVIHGDQEVGNRKRVVLRLAEAMVVNDKDVPAGTLVYGMSRLSQDRIQVTVSRIGQQVVSYRIYDHTYHAGILLDERNDVVQDATKETLARRGQRELGRYRTGQLPTDIASDVARNLLQRSRRRKQTVFLPDGYPLYLSPY